MKRKVWFSIKKYIYIFGLDITFFLLSIIILLILKGNFNSVFSKDDIYMIYICPLYFLIRAILCRKQILFGIISSTMIFFEIWLGFPLISLDFRFYLLFSVEWLALPTIVFVINLIFSIVAYIIHKLVVCLKKNFQKLDE